MILYRIQTEDINFYSIIQIVQKRFDAFSTFKGNGYWKGKREASLTIEIMENDGALERVKEIAREIKEINGQECVLVTRYVVDGVDYI